MKILKLLPTGDAPTTSPREMVKVALESAGEVRAAAAGH